MNCTAVWYNNPDITIIEGRGQMQTIAYEAYYENGNLYTKNKQPLKLPERSRIFIAVLNDSADNLINQEPYKRSFSELRGKYKGKIHMSEDFDAPLDELAEYMWWVI